MYILHYLHILRNLAQSHYFRISPIYLSFGLYDKEIQTKPKVMFIEVKSSD